MDRARHSSGSSWEAAVGYSRAVRVDGRVIVSGTTAIDDDGSVIAPGDPYRQTVAALEIVESALAAFDCDLAEVVRTRLFVTDIDDWEEIGRAHREFFSTAKPATTMVEIARLIDPDLLVEIEAEAITASGGDRVPPR